jgi:YVTN family beta-propeller protein
MAVAITPDGKRVYVTNYYWQNYQFNTITVIDTATNTVVGDPISVGVAPQGVAITPDGRYVYVTNYGSNTVSVIDTATNNKVVGDVVPSH